MGASAQLPYIDLPGAEYFSLAPNRTVSLQGRRRFANGMPGQSIAASATQQFGQIITIEQPFPPTAGIYIHRAFLNLFPQDQSQALQIVSTVLALNLSGNAFDFAYPLGLPVTTQLQPAGALTAIQERDVLVTFQDVRPFSGVAPVGLPGLLAFTFQVSIHNTSSTSAHSIQPNAGIVYTRLDGVLE